MARLTFKIHSEAKNFNFAIIFLFIVEKCWWQLNFGDSQKWWQSKCRWRLVAIASSLDGYCVKFGFGDDGNLSMEVNAEIKI